MQTIPLGAVMFLNRGSRDEVLWSLNTRDSWLHSENLKLKVETNDCCEQIWKTDVMYFPYQLP